MRSRARVTSCALTERRSFSIAGCFKAREATPSRKTEHLPVPIAEIDSVVLSHAHIDHSGRLPFLIAEGYSKTIWATAATRDLCAVMLADSAHIQEKDAEFLAKRQKEFVQPLYGMRHAVRTMELMVAVPYNKPFDVVPGVRGTYVDAGHILGSASVVLDCVEGGETRRLVFSGISAAQVLPSSGIRYLQPALDELIMESTYGDRDHESVDGARAKLAEVVRETAARGGRVLIPAFAVGRTQEIVYNLHSLIRESAIPSIPIYIDSPLAIDTTTVFEMHPEVFDQSEDMVKKGQGAIRLSTCSLHT